MLTLCGIASKTNIDSSYITAMLNSMQKNGNYDKIVSQQSVNDSFYSIGINRDCTTNVNYNFTNCIILFDGILWDKCHICEELSKAGFNLQGNSDEEIIAQAYHCWGENFPQHINGMFAIIIFDLLKDTILFVRDRIGKKNLYYYYLNDTVVFSTEFKAFFECEFIEKSINTETLGHFMRHGFVPNDKTILNNIYKLSPGTCIKISNGDISEHKYWDLLQVYKQQRKYKINNYQTAKNELVELIKTCIKDRILDVKKCGFFLSSGIDSSLISALANEILKEKINTYTIGVNDVKYNEADIAFEISSHLNSNHHEHYISEEDILNCIDSLTEYYDEPFGDSSSIPCMILNKFVKENSSFSLGGDGGDEIFCGYPRYKFLHLAQKFDFLGGILKTILPNAVIKKLPHSIQRVIENRNPNIKAQLVMEEEIEPLEKLIKNPFNPPYYECEVSMEISNWQDRRMLLDMMTTLPDDMIYKVNRSCAYGDVQVLSPLLDYRIIEFSFRLPRKFKYSKGVTKKILRDIVTEYIPKEILDTPKRGFSVPIESWLRTSLKDKINDYSNKEFLEKQNLFNWDYVQEHLSKFLSGDENNASIWWNFLIFQLWYEKYML